MFPANFDLECVAVGQLCAAAKMRLDERGPEAYRTSFAAYRGPKSFPSYYERKELSLRLSAIKRGMVVDPSVTPDFLERVTEGRCPVTLEPLDTRGKSPQNPSVDRLVNEVTYLAGNICVLSMRANRAKGEKTFEEVAALAQAGVPSDGLAPVEWMRLASLMYGAWAHAYRQADPYLLPLAATPGPGMFMSTSQVIQLLLTRHFGGCGQQEVATNLWLDMTRRSGCAEGVFLEFRDQLVQALVEESHPGDAWLRGQVFEAFVRWYSACSERVNSEVEGLLRHHQASLADSSASREWAPRGRYQH